MNNTKAIIIAAGIGIRLNPLTNNKPKCLLKIGGKTIMERQLATLREYGINDITIVRGYKGGMINFPEIRYYENTNYANNNILNSLFYAEKEMNGEFIVSYSDILYDKSVIEKLLNSQNDISLVVDTDWQEYYQGRTEHPIEQGENIIIRDGKILKIGKHLTADESHGEFIGMAKFSEKGGDIFKREFQRVKNQYWDKPFQEANIFEKAYLTDMFQELIDQGFDCYPVEIQKNWWEIDTKQDFQKVKKIFNSLNL